MDNRRGVFTFGFRADTFDRETILKKDDALKIQKLIEELCEQNDLYVYPRHVKEPDLKRIEIEISIKIDPTTTIRREG